MNTPQVRSIVRIASSGTEQGVSRAAVYTYVNTGNTSAEVAATDFFDGVSKFDFDVNDILYATLSNGFFIMQFTSSTTAAVRIS